MKALPAELQTRYISLLSSKSLSSLCLVSRNTRNIAFPLLYRSLVLNPHSIGPLARRIVSENEQDASSLHDLRITDYVRELTFLYPRRRGYSGIDQEELRLATQALPFLKNISHLRWYETILDSDSDQHPEPEFSTFVQTMRDVFGEKLQNLEIHFQSCNEDHTYSVESPSRIPV
ncbi:hypothetical protein BDZ94DRAFT_720162 [Collybia nuda]|uniref:F-box domain-containing protein n=1 Tax=Collybia nuda TaxID=64659 RepID=A0A9P6CJ39_9AGAR|nr:hypothetical protein BDZ94DRAFT_720162 [Collybia nuda]